jgi:hypothetical protein
MKPFGVILFLIIPLLSYSQIQCTVEEAGSRKPVENAVIQYDY